MSLVKGVALLLLLIAIGTTFGIHGLDLDMTDAVYWATITGCSIGFGDIVPSEHPDGSTFVAGKWFAIFYIVFFFLFLLQALSWVSQYLSAMLRRQNVKAALRMKLSKQLVDNMDVDGVRLFANPCLATPSYLCALTLYLQDGSVDRSEFLAAILVANQIAPPKVVRAILDRFDELDTDKDGCLTASDISAALSPDTTLPRPLVSRTDSAKSQIEVHTPPDSCSASLVVTQEEVESANDVELPMGFDTSSNNSAASPDASATSALTQVRVSEPL